MIGYIKALLRVAPFKTLYLNYRLFPLKIAVRLPIVVGRGTIIRKVGKVVLDCPVQTGLMTIGVSYLFNDKRTNQGIWDNAGTIVLAGKVTVHTGISLYTRKNGKILMGGGK